MKKREAIVPVILAAGPARALGFPKALARFGRRTALELAVENCAGLAKPVVVLGWEAGRVRRAVPRGVHMVVNRAWQAGQLRSLLAGLRRAPGGAAVLLYPVDYPLLTPAVVRRLAEAFRARRSSQAVVVPVFRGRSGHPVVFAAALRRELARARTAREVVERYPARVRRVRVRTSAIGRDFGTPASYRRLRRAFRRRRARRSEKAGSPRT